MGFYRIKLGIFMRIMIQCFGLVFFILFFISFYIIFFFFCYEHQWLAAFLDTAAAAHKTILQGRDVKLRG